MNKLNIVYLAFLCWMLAACGGGTTPAETVTASTSSTNSATLNIEKPPLAIAKELGYFEEEGLFVTIEAQSNWKNVLDRVIDGQLDGSHMLAGQPIAAGAGFGRQAELITPFSMDLNGNGITVSNDVWSKMKPHVPMKGGKPIHPIKAEAIKPVIEEYKSNGKAFKMGMVFPVSTHNYEIRYWLAAAGINPGMYTANNIQGQVDADVLLSVTPPPQMPATLEAGTIYGYCVGEPWNQQAVFKGIGVPVTTNQDIWKNNPEKVFVIRKDFAEKYPNTTTAITKALIRAGKWLDEPGNRPKAVGILSMPDYVGADDGVWFLTQMRRWGQIPNSKPADWYDTTIKNIYRPDLWKTAAQALVKDGKIPASDIPVTDGYKPVTTDFIDGTKYDGKDPLGYINSFKIGNKDNVQ